MIYNQGYETNYYSIYQRKREDPSYDFLKNNPLFPARAKGVGNLLLFAAHDALCTHERQTLECGNNFFS